MSRAAKGADCKSAGYAFAGSSPASPTTVPSAPAARSLFGPMRSHRCRPCFTVECMSRCLDIRPAIADSQTQRGCSSMVEQQPSKLNTRVRFPVPAPDLRSAVEFAPAVRSRSMAEAVSGVTSRTRHLRSFRPTFACANSAGGPPRRCSGQHSPAFRGCVPGQCQRLVRARSTISSPRPLNTAFSM